MGGDGGSVSVRLGLCLSCAAAAVLCASCSTPPAQNDGLVGMLYHAAVRPDPVQMQGARQKRVAPSQTSAHDEASVAAAGADESVDAGPGVEPPAYRISPGDILAVSYFSRPPTGTNEYLVESQDVLIVSVAGQETYASEVVVRPDGYISFFFIGDLMARGRTVAQIREQAAARLMNIVPGAEVTVILKQANGQVQDFLNTLRSAEQGSTRVMQVRYDGAVTFPLVGELTAMGKTLAELSREVEAEYDSMFGGGISVALNLNSSADGNVAVLGEVRNPGRYTIDTPISPFFALAMAGGALDTAKESQVVVVKRQVDGRVAWHVVNLDIGSARPLGPEIPLAPQDMLLVPKSGIADLNLFVDQYIRRLIPVSVGYESGSWEYWVSPR